MATETITAAQIKDVKNFQTSEQLVEALQDVDVLPLWAQMARLNPPLPSPKTKPYKWEYEKIRPYLMSAGELVKEQQAERRVLMLVNPAVKQAPYTTDTLYSGIQLVNPRETAPAHRHTAFAMRFIIEGKGGYTAVQGLRVPMQPRDVILTPTWNWHDHGKKGADEEGGDDNPVIWLDGLDLPFHQFLPTHFNEHYADPRYPAEDAPVSPIVFPWADVQKQLDEQEGPYASTRYLKADGREVSRTIGAGVERIDAKSSSPRVHETSSSVYHVVEGSGYSIIGGQRIDWKAGDTFAIPAWYENQHFAGEKRVYLYHFDDKPALKALGTYRVAGQSDESLAAAW